MHRHQCDTNAKRITQCVELTLTIFVFHDDHTLFDVALFIALLRCHQYKRCNAYVNTQYCKHRLRDCILTYALRRLYSIMFTTNNEENTMYVMKHNNNVCDTIYANTI